MSPDCLGDVFIKATVLAEQSGVSEINVDILLCALDALEAHDAAEVYPASNCLRISTESEGYAFSLDNSVWFQVSAQAANALSPFTGSEPRAEDIAASGMEPVDLATLRRNLQEQGREGGLSD
jgi:hypothetical protein